MAVRHSRKQRRKYGSWVSIRGTLGDLAGGNVSNRGNRQEQKNFTYQDLSKTLLKGQIIEGILESF
jgi:hypothetical protein